MKIKVDEKNKTVIAYGSYHGRKIKGVAVCREPVFDEEFGIKLAEKKYKVKELYEKLRHHEKSITTLKEIKRKADAMIKDHNMCAEKIDIRLQKSINDCESFVNEYFNK